MKSNKHELLPPDFHTRTPLEKERYLDSNADQVYKNETIRRPLSDDEKESLRYKLQKASIKLHDTQEQYTEVKKEWNEDIKAQREDVSEVLTQLRSGHAEEQGNKYLIRDYDNSRVVTFTKEGVEIESRPMLAEERQSTIQSSMRKIENDN